MRSVVQGSQLLTRKYIFFKSTIGKFDAVSRSCSVYREYGNYNLPHFFWVQQTHLLNFCVICLFTSLSRKIEVKIFFKRIIPLTPRKIKSDLGNPYNNEAFNVIHNMFFAKYFYAIRGKFGILGRERREDIFYNFSLCIPL